MGTVYRARHTALDMAVAIKVLREPLEAESAEASQQRFVQEARALAKIRSEYVCRPLDFGNLESGEPYLVLEHLEGTTLSELTAQRRPSFEEAIDIVIQAAAGLAEAHRVGLVHRDVKPSNIFVAQGQGRRPVAKLVDFGLSKTRGLGPSITAGDRVVGTPKFMSPEQIRRAPIDHRTDIWSLGVVLFSLLTERYPFTGSSNAALFASVLDDPATPLVMARPDLPAELCRAVDACFEKNPVDRMPWTGALAQALAPFASTAGKLAAEVAIATGRTDQSTAEVPLRAAAAYALSASRTAAAAQLASATQASAEDGEEAPPTEQMAGARTLRMNQAEPRPDEPPPVAPAREFSTPKPR